GSLSAFPSRRSSDLVAAPSTAARDFATEGFSAITNRIFLYLHFVVGFFQFSGNAVAIVQKAVITDVVIIAVQLSQQVVDDDTARSEEHTSERQSRFD